MALRREAGTLSGTLYVLCLPSLALAQQQAHVTPPATATASVLPVRDVTLFSSGVSYTLREGEVNGDATIPLTFRTTQINDILKSMVLLDSRGSVRPAVYAAKDPIGRTLQSFAVDVSQPTDRVSLLNRLKGAQVAVEGGGTVLAASTTTEKFSLEGQLVGVDKESANGYGYQGNILTVLGASGLQSVRLDEIRSIRFLDESINREFRDALTLQASGSDDKRRQVILRFDGSGKRTVRVGYISESPLWKISYRLLIGGTDEKASGKPYLQGWALVENTTDEDWNGVRLSLVSGRPVSFIQDLYQPLYLPRPVVPPDIVASPFPQLAEADIVEKKAEGAALSLDSAASRKTAGVSGGGFAGGASFRNSGRRDSGGAGPTAAAAPAAMAADYAGIENSVQSAASGKQVGELFQYSITSHVTLPRQQAAMIPVIAQDIAGEKVSLYNADSDPRFPLSAFWLRNNTPLHIKGGPITVFDDGTYAGDARVEDVAPGDARLVTYAIDLAVTGERIGPQYSGVETSLSLRRGVLVINRKDRQTTKYTLLNKAKKQRAVIVEHPFDASYALVEPAKALSRTPAHYRFDVTVPPGKSGSLTVVTERLDSQTIALLDGDLPELQVYAGRSDVAGAIKDALKKVMMLRAKVKSTQGTIAGFDSEVSGITADQDRIRKNMAELDRNSALYKRYISELDAEETRIGFVRTEQDRLRGVAASADQELRSYLDTLTIGS